MSRLDAPFGLSLALGVVGALPFAMSATSGGHDLEVRAPSAYGLQSSPHEPIHRLDFTPRSDRVRIEHSRQDGNPGIDLVTHRASYGDAWHREVTWPSLVGPFHSEGADVCGYSIRLGAGLFDTSGAGRGLKDVVVRKLSGIFPYVHEIEEHDIRVHFPAVLGGNFTVSLRNGWASIHVALWLVDGTSLSVQFPVWLISRGGSPVVERIPGEPLKVEFKGPVRDEIEKQARRRGETLGSLVGCGIGFFFGPLGCIVAAGSGLLVGSEVAREKTEKEIPTQLAKSAATRIDEALADLALGMENIRKPWSPSTSRPQDAIRLRLSGSPTISPTAITLPLCVSVSVGLPRSDPTVPGSIHTGAGPITHQSAANGSPTIELAMSADALNQLMYYVWQTGMLGELGRSDLILEGLSRSVRAAAFDFKGLDPRLPPVLDPAEGEGESLPFVLANVEIGHMDRRTVVGHGRADLRVQQEGDTIRLAGAVKDLRLNCAAREGTSVVLTPCLGDLLPIAREKAARAPITHAIPGGEVLGKLPTLSFQGMRLRLSALRVATSGNPSRMDTSVRAQIEAP